MQYSGDNVNWTDVDSGAEYATNCGEDRDKYCEVLFKAPVEGRYFKIMPRSWENQISLRAGLILARNDPNSKLVFFDFRTDFEAADFSFKNGF